MAPLLVTPEALQELPRPARLVDVRWKLGDPRAGRAIFEQGHIPGAVYVDLDDELAAPPGSGGRHPLPSPGQFERAMSAAGVDDGTWVIAYDDGGAGAPRLWWLLRHFGHAEVSILDGGYPGWLRAGRLPETGPGARPESARFHATERQGDIVDVDALRQALQRHELHVLDARAPERWRGEIEPVDRLPGRIPGALNVPAADNLRSDGRFRSPDELRERYAALGVLDGKPIVVSCGSGVSACVNLVAMELAGITNAHLFPGSYSGWIAHGLPVETGPG